MAPPKRPSRTPGSGYVILCYAEDDRHFWVAPAGDFTRSIDFAYRYPTLELAQKDARAVECATLLFWQQTGAKFKRAVVIGVTGHRTYRGTFSEN